MARVIADNIAGRDRTARYDGIPRVVFTDPEVAAVGPTTEQAQQRASTPYRPRSTWRTRSPAPGPTRTNPRGHLGVLADADRRILIGAWAAGPQPASGSTQPPSLCASRSRSCVCSTRSAQFPTYNEGWLKGIERLKL
ncbi:MAG: hypothetical protein M4D85_02620 [Actinomycetota bacterium]|nr:hypothetical protein [Actinomycetota bacterium]